MRERLGAVWLSEHATIFPTDYDFPIQLSSATVGAGFGVLFQATQDPPYQTVGGFVPSWKGGSPFLSVDSGVLVVGIDPRVSGVPGRYELRMVSAEPSFPLIQTAQFAKPMIRQPELRLEVSIPDGAGGGVLSIILDLSGHADPEPRSQGLIYEIGRGLVPDTTPSGDTVVVVRVPLDGDDGVFESLLLDLRSPMLLLTDGDDNTLSVLRLAVESADGPSRFALRNIRVASLEPDRGRVVQAARDLAARHQARSGLLTPLGFEEHRFPERMPNGEPPHVNALLPSGADLQGMVPLTAGPVGTLVEAIHAAGGLASLNHPFGTSPSGGTGALQADRAVALADYLQSVGAWQADLLEVGYASRGFAGIADHLALWDELARRGLRLCGVGSSDSHGGLPGDAGQFGRFATWVWVEDRSQDGLLNGLGRCSAFFGDPSSWTGTLDLQVDDQFAGSVLANPARSVTARAYLTTDPSSPIGGPFRLVLVELTSEGMGRRLVTVDRPVSIEADKVILVRLEMWTTDGTPIAFTNPVWFRTLQQ
jgi:hypothetical protein